MRISFHNSHARIQCRISRSRSEIVVNRERHLAHHNRTHPNIRWEARSTPIKQGNSNTYRCLQSAARYSSRRRPTAGQSLQFFASASSIRPWPELGSHRMRLRSLQHMESITGPYFCSFRCQDWFTRQLTCQHSGFLHVGKLTSYLAAQLCYKFWEGGSERSPSFKKIEVLSGYLFSDNSSSLSQTPSF